MAIGTAKLFGIELKQNFKYPYFSRDIAEFWRRWHISLTSWFRDYIYIPLGGSRCSKIKILRNTAIVFLVSGLWHGANWTFVVWGAYHAFLLCLLILVGKSKRYKDPVAQGRILPSIKEFGQMLLTFALATLGWIIFRADTISQAFGFIKGIFNSSLFSIPFLSSRVYYILLAVCLLVALGEEWIQRRNEHGLTRIGNKWHIRFLYIFCVITIFLCIILNETGNPEFIYSQF